jgi:hypothetical protein
MMADVDIKVTYINLTEESKKSIVNLVVDLIRMSQEKREIDNKNL